MKSIYYGTIFLFLSFNATAQITDFGYSLNKHHKLDKKDWQIIKKDFDSLLTHGNWLEFGTTQSNDVKSLFSRVASINWDIDSIDKIEAYINFFIIESMSKYLDVVISVQKDNLPDYFSQSYFRLPYFAFRSLNEIGGQVFCSTLEQAIFIDKQLYNQFTRVILATVELSYFDKNYLSDCIQTLTKKEVIGEDLYPEIVSSIKFRNAITRLDQKEGFMQIYSKLEKEGWIKIPIDVGKWASDIKIIDKTHKKIDILYLFDLYNKTEKFEEKYFWFYCSLFYTNVGLSRNRVFSRSEKEIIQDAIKSFQAKYFDQLTNPKIIKYDLTTQMSETILRKIKLDRKESGNIINPSKNYLTKSDAPRRRRVGSVPHTVTRIEERGEDFSKRSTENLISLFKKIDFQIYKGKNHENPQAVNLRKAAQVLGDRYLAETFNPSTAQQKVISKAVNGYIDLYRSSEGDDSSEALHQIIRLWHMAVPTLLDHIEDKDRKKFLFVASVLIDIQNEEIIENIIVQAKKNKEEHMSKRYIQLLSLMNLRARNPCDFYIKNRSCADNQEVLKWYNKLVLPVVAELEEK